MSNSWSIYSIKCQRGLCNIGQIKRDLKYRIKEHKQNIQKQETKNSAIVKHCWEMNHTFNSNSAKTISKPTYFYT